MPGHDTQLQNYTESQLPPETLQEPRQSPVRVITLYSLFSETLRAETNQLLIIILWVFPSGLFSLEARPSRCGQMIVWDSYTAPGASDSL